MDIVNLAAEGRITVHADVEQERIEGSASDRGLAGAFDDVDEGVQAVTAVAAERYVDIGALADQVRVTQDDVDHSGRVKSPDALLAVGEADVEVGRASRGDGDTGGVENLTTYVLLESVGANFDLDGGHWAAVFRSRGDAVPDDGELDVDFAVEKDCDGLVKSAVGVRCGLRHGCGEDTGGRSQDGTEDQGLTHVDVDGVLVVSSKKDCEVDAAEKRRMYTNKKQGKT